METNMSTLSDDLRGIVSRLHAFSWESFTTRTNTIGARGVGEDQGKPNKYGAAAKRVLGSQNGKASGKPGQKPKEGNETRTDPTRRGKGALSQRGGVADLDKKAPRKREKPLELPKPEYEPMVLDVVESPGARKQREKANAEAGFGYWAYAVDRDGNATIHRHNTESDARHTHGQMKVGNNFKTVGSFKKEASLDEVKKAIEGRGWKVKNVHGVTGKAPALQNLRGMNLPIEQIRGLAKQVGVVGANTKAGLLKDIESALMYQKGASIRSKY